MADADAEDEEAGLIPIIGDLRTLSKHELKMSHFFKCSLDFKTCSFTTNYYNRFVNHVSDHFEAKYSCYYCSKTKLLPVDFAEHIVRKHGYRLYQCNLCLYRASRITFVEIHHITCHPDNYELAISNSQNVDRVPSQIIACPQVVFGPLLSAQILFASRYTRQPQFENGKKMYQCLFCPTHRTTKAAIGMHISERHPDRQICFYEPNETITIPEPVAPVVEIVNDGVVPPEAANELVDLLEKDLAISESDGEPEAAPDLPDEVEPPPARVRQSRVETAMRNGQRRQKRLRALEIAAQEEQEEEIKIPFQKRRKPNHQATSMEALPIASKTAQDGGYCLLCDCIVKKNSLHQAIKHFRFGLKCSVCEFLGTQKDVIAHIKQVHATQRACVVKFIVNSGETQPVPITRMFGPDVDEEEDLEPGPKQSSSKPPKAKRDKSKGKGYLLEKITESTYLGPLQGERTPGTQNHSEHAPPS